MGGARSRRWGGGGLNFRDGALCRWGRRRRLRSTGRDGIGERGPSAEPQARQQVAEPLAPGGDPHDPPAASAARAPKKDEGEDPLQQRRPRESPRSRGRGRSRSIPGHDARPGRPHCVLDRFPRRGDNLRAPSGMRRKHPMESARMKPGGGNEHGKLLDQLPGDPVTSAWSRRGGPGAARRAAGPRSLSVNRSRASGGRRR